MAHQVEDIEVFRAYRKILRHIEEKPRHGIIRIFVELILREPGDPTDNRVGANEGKRNSSKAFQDRMGTLQKYTDFENLVDAMFRKSCHENTFWQD